MKRQNRKTLLIMILALCMIISLVTALPISAGAETKSGKCGANLTWSLTDDGTLTISGTGRMDDYSASWGQWTGKFQSINTPWYEYRSSIVNLIIHEGVTNISHYAFAKCVSLKNISIPNSVKSIGANAFWDCTGLSKITVPDSVEGINEHAFMGCTSLTTAKLSKSITIIPTALFDSCSSLVEIIIPNGVTTIKNEAFENCRTLANITIPKSILSIGQYAFNNLPNIKNIYYEGNENDWANIVIDTGNDDLSNGTKKYNTYMDTPTITPTPNTVTPPPVTITPVPNTVTPAPINPDITPVPDVTPSPSGNTTPNNNNNNNNIGGTTTIINNNTTNTIVTNNTATNNTVTNNTTTNNNITNNTNITNNIVNNVSLILYIGKTTANVGGESVENDVAPIVRNDRTMLPARFVAEQLGAKVDWNQDLKQVIITKGDKLITIPIGSDKAYVNNEAQTLDSPAFVENDRTYTPVRFIAENLDANVEWNGNDQSVTITEK